MNPHTGEIGELTPEALEAWRTSQFDAHKAPRELSDPLLDGEEPSAPTDPSQVPVHLATVEGGSGRAHVVDEDAPEATLCGRPVAFVGRVSTRRACPGCRRELRDRWQAGEWRGAEL